MGAKKTQIVEIKDDDSPFGVMEAVNEVLRRHGIEFLEVEDQQLDFRKEDGLYHDRLVTYKLTKGGKDDRRRR